MMYEERGIMEHLEQGRVAKLESYMERTFTLSLRTSGGMDTPVRSMSYLMTLTNKEPV